MPSAYCGKRRASRSSRYSRWALGTGANSAVFSFVDALLLRPLPVLRPGEVLTISGTGKTQDNPFANMSYREYLDFREQSRTLKDFVAVSVFRVGYSLSP